MKSGDIAGQRKGLLSAGASLLWRRQEILWWVFAVNVVLAGPLVGHVAAARRATAGLAVDGSALCEYLPGRAARASRRRPGPAYPDDARLRGDGGRLPDLLLLPHLCAAPRSRRRRNMGGTAPVRTRARPAVASAAFVSRDLGDPHCGRNRRMAGPRLGTLDLLELRDH